MSRQSRKQLVLKVLSEHPETREDKKALLIHVWMEEGATTLQEVLNGKYSSPAGVDRDRRRKNVLELFPRSEDKYEYFLEYKNEFSPAGQWAMRLE